MNNESKPISLLEKATSAIFYLSTINKSIHGNIEIYHSHNTPYPETITFVTNGLKDHLDHEIIMHCMDNEIEECLSTIKMLSWVILENHYIFGDGTTFGNDEELPDIKGKTGFFITDPIYFESLLDSEYFMAIPVFKSELDYIRNIGRDQFKDLMDSNPNIDLISMHRESFVKKRTNLH
jgi:hypothetical protein